MIQLAELDSRLVLELPLATEYLSLDDIHNAVVNRLNVLTMFSRTSSVHVLLGTTDEFTPDSLDYDVTALIGKGVPAFIEMRGQSGQDGTLLSWRNIRVVPLSQINDYRQQGLLACAFYGDEADNNIDQPTQYLRFTYLPQNVCRIRFDRDLERTALEAATLLPDNLGELVVLQAQQTLIPRIKMQLAVDMRRDKELMTVAPSIAGALNEVYLQNRDVDIPSLYQLWKIWAFSDRSEEDSFNLPTPRSSNLYVGGRGQWGFGNGGSSY